MLPSFQLSAFQKKKCGGKKIHEIDYFQSYNLAMAAIQQSSNGKII